MTTPILLALAVDDLPAAFEVAAAAQEAGATAIRLLDAGLDPSVVAGALAGRYGDLGYVVDVPTTHNAPYNTARRILSLDRSNVGRIGVALRPGDGDEVSDAAAGAVPDAPQDQRWTEYAQVLAQLWESFPREALVGDQERGIVIDASRVRRIDHVGPSYRVAGPLDGPSSVQGRPVLVAADVDVVGWTAVAASADVVVVAQTAGADEALTAALAAVGRRRDEVALIGRVTVDAVNGVPSRLADELRTRVAAHRLDGLELVPLGRSRGVLAAARRLLPLLTEPHPPTTLRAALRLPELVGAHA